MFEPRVIYQVIDDFGRLRDYGTDQARAMTLAAGVCGRVVPVASWRWYMPQHHTEGMHPADRDNAAEIAWEKQQLLEAAQRREVPPLVRPNRFGPPLPAELFGDCP